jgi:hypothetical protein
MKYVSLWARWGGHKLSHYAFRKHQSLQTSVQYVLTSNRRGYYVGNSVSVANGPHPHWYNVSHSKTNFRGDIQAHSFRKQSRSMSPICVVLPLSRVKIYEVTALHCDSSIIMGHCFLMRRSWITNYTVGRGLNKNVSKHKMIAPYDTHKPHTQSSRNVQGNSWKIHTHTSFKETHYPWRRKSVRVNIHDEKLPHPKTLNVQLMFISSFAGLEPLATPTSIMRTGRIIIC